MPEPYRLQVAVVDQDEQARRNVLDVDTSLEVLSVKLAEVVIAAADARPDLTASRRSLTSL